MCLRRGEIVEVEDHRTPGSRTRGVYQASEGGISVVMFAGGRCRVVDTALIKCGKDQGQDDQSRNLAVEGIDLCMKGKFQEAMQMLRDLRQVLAGWMMVVLVNMMPEPKQYTMLHHAARAGRADMVELLLEAGAEPGRLSRAIGGPRQIPSDLARTWSKNPQLANRLDEALAERLFSLVMDESPAPCFSFAPGVLPTEARSADGRVDFGWSPEGVLCLYLEEQLQRDDLERVEQLVNMERPGTTGEQRLLGRAVKRGWVRAVESLLKAGARVDPALEAGSSAEIAGLLREARGQGEQSQFFLLSEEERQAKANEAIEDLKQKKDGHLWMTHPREYPEIATIVPAERRFSLLHHICWFKNRDALQSLLALREVDVTVRTTDGLNLVHCAMAGSTLTVVAGKTTKATVGVQLAAVFQIVLDTLRRGEFSPDSSTVKFFPRSQAVPVHVGPFRKFFQVGDQLGKGSTGKVYAVAHKGAGVERAVKVMKQEIFRDVASLKVIDHPHVLKLFDLFRDEGRVFVVMQRAQQGDLRQGLLYVHQQKALDPKTARWAKQVCKQILLALEYCHGQQVPQVHGNLKPENVLIMNSGPQMLQHPYVALADLSAARQSGEPRRTWNTPGYAAPELLADPEAECPESDMFAFGCLVFYMQTGDHAFYHPNMLARESPGESKKSRESGGKRVVAPQVLEDLTQMHRLGPGSRVENGGPTKEGQWRRLFGAEALGRGLLGVDKSRRSTAAACLENEWVRSEDHSYSGPVQPACPSRDVVALAVATLVPDEAPSCVSFHAADVTGRAALGRHQWAQAMLSQGFSREQAEESWERYATQRGKTELLFSDFAVACIAEDDDRLRRLILTAEDRLIVPKGAKLGKRQYLTRSMLDRVVQGPRCSGCSMCSNLEKWLAGRQSLMALIFPTLVGEAAGTSKDDASSLRSGKSQSAEIKFSPCGRVNKVAEGDATMLKEPVCVS
mmetsp:Transcript_53775/g.123335  ORF Transcript_53775/g.123335 Transcript_53775/m.123335 type:complete len:962 (-) Transcript_53775:305-3190(-)